MQGTRHSLDFAVACGAKKFLLTSSGAVYGKQPSEITHVPEDYTGAPDPLSPSSAYGEGKRAAELLCAIYHKQHGLETKIARCFAFVGPYLPLDVHFAIGNFIRDAINGHTIRIAGDGTPYRSYLYTADLTVWLWCILFKGVSSRPYNVGSDAGTTISELARTVASVSQRVVEVLIAKNPISEKRPDRYIPSIERASRELNLISRIQLRQAIQKTMAWYSR